MSVLPPGRINKAQAARAEGDEAGTAMWKQIAAACDGLMVGECGTRQGRATFDPDVIPSLSDVKMAPLETIHQRH